MKYMTLNWYQGSGDTRSWCPQKKNINKLRKGILIKKKKFTWKQIGNTEYKDLCKKKTLKMHLVFAFLEYFVLLISYSTT